MLAYVKADLDSVIEMYLGRPSHCVLVLDIPTPFLDETLPPLHEVSMVISALNSICKHLLLYVNPFIGTHSDILTKIPILVPLYKRGLVIDYKSTPRVKASIHTQGLHNTLTIEVANPNNLGTTIVFSIPRTCDAPPILTPSALYVYYLTDSSSRALLRQGFTATHLNIATILRYTTPHLAIVSLSKCISGDGPIFGYPEYIDTAFFVGKPHLIDIALALCLGYTLHDIYFVKLINDAHNLNKLFQLANHFVKSITTCRKVKRHSLYHYHRRLLITKADLHT
ncbi:MAG TPA: hypothetical protein EYP48_02355 [Ignisphaera sp.]|uniref:DUF362 domain-containing protein n=1 Tax=Ignisphaera aggregans TaxID=334771 RepID=A0A832YZ48_9CREN|nr:hypothetical protein [Ignisphaera sp.]HIP56792.1 hypothetical protein [Ignisphaera aggregans]